MHFFTVFFMSDTVCSAVYYPQPLPATLTGAPLRLSLYNSAQWILQYSAQCMVHSLQCKVCTVQCTLYGGQFTLYSGNYTLYTVQCTVHHSLECPSLQCVADICHAVQWHREILPSQQVTYIIEIPQFVNAKFKQDEGN